MGLFCLLIFPFAGLEARIPPTRWEEKPHERAASGIRREGDAGYEIVIYYFDPFDGAQHLT
jgi:hypothetical protein